MEKVRSSVCKQVETGMWCVVKDSSKRKVSSAQKAQKQSKEEFYRCSTSWCDGMLRWVWRRRMIGCGDSVFWDSLLQLQHYQPHADMSSKCDIAEVNGRRNACETPSVSVLVLVRFYIGFSGKTARTHCLSARLYLFLSFLLFCLQLLVFTKKIVKY